MPYEPRRSVFSGCKKVKPANPYENMTSAELFAALRSARTSAALYLILCIALLVLISGLCLHLHKVVNNGIAEELGIIHQFQSDAIDAKVAQYDPKYGYFEFLTPQQIELNLAVSQVPITTGSDDSSVRLK